MSTQIAGVTETLHYKDEDYVVYPLKDIHYAEMEQWMQDRLISVTKRNITDLNEKERQALLMQAFEKASQLTFYSEEASAILNTLEGASRLIWHSIKQGRPEFTLENARELSNDPVFAATALIKIEAILAPFMVEEPKKKQVKRKRQPRAKKSTGHSAGNTAGRRKKSPK